MKLTRNKIFLGIILFWLLINFLTFFGVGYFYSGTLFSFVFLMIVPGLLLMLILKIKKIGFWEYLVYTIGLSIAFLMFGGLLINWFLPLIGVSQPLSLYPVLVSFDFIFYFLILAAYTRSKDLSFEFRLARISFLSWVFFLTPLLFPILAILGAISLNNHGPNYLTMIMLGGIAFYVSLMIIFGKKLNPNLYPLAVFFMGLSILLMTSLRGWYITGHDIQQEYYVFQLTKNRCYWSISHYRDPYNACLSLTVLPTIFSSFLNLGDLYIYKILFQIIFSFSVISIFLFLKRYSNETIAFLSVFLFMSFPTFLNDMPMLNRQEMALLFFALMLLVLFDKKMKLRVRESLFLFFGFGMVVSHYSTSYVALALFIFTYFFSFVLKKIRKGKKNYYLTGTMILGLILFTFFLNIQLTRTSGGLQDLIFQVYKNIGKSFSQDLKSGDVLYSLFSWQKLDKNKLLDEYVLSSIKEVELSEERDLYFEKDTWGKYKISLLDNEILPLTFLGRRLTEISFDMYSLNYYLRQFTAKMIQILIGLGFLGFIFKKKKYAKNVDLEYNVLVFGSIVLLGLLIILPLFSVEYGTLRFFQQTLVILALPAVIGVLVIFSFWPQNTRLFFLLIILILFFLSLSGFIPQLSGGYYPLLNLNNRGLYYDAYYTHKSEVSSVKWLSENFSDEYPIQVNLFAGGKMLALVGLFSIEKILPVAAGKGAYVYLDYSNVRDHKNNIFYKGNIITYDYPVEFLDENKDLIYNDGGARVFK